MAVNFAAVAGLLLTAVAMRAVAQESAASAPGEDGKLFDWGRPCTLVGNDTEVQVQGANNGPCTYCGSGSSAKPDPTCSFKPLEFAVGDKLNIFYHSSIHHLYLGDAKCVYTTEVCPNGTSTEVSKTTPCTYTFATPGSFFISDKSGQGGAEDGEYCDDYGAYLPVTVTTAA